MYLCCSSIQILQKYRFIIIIYTFIEKIKNKSITNRWIKDYVYQLDFIEQECTFNFRSKTQHYNFRYNADDEAQIIKIIHPSYRN